MIEPDNRDIGFYWISIDGRAAEVAQWQVEWDTWLVMGRTRPLTDEQCVNLTVLGVCLPPPHPAYKAIAAVSSRALTAI